MAETLSNLSFVCYILAAIFLVVGITLFILLRIPKTFSDYTGRTARRKIMKIRDANEKTGNKSIGVIQSKLRLGNKYNLCVYDKNVNMKNHMAINPNK